MCYKYCYCSNKNKEAKPQTLGNFKTQEKNLTQFFGFFRIVRCEKDVKKPGLVMSFNINMYLSTQLFVLMRIT